MVDELIAAKHPAGSAHQRAENEVFIARKFEFLAEIRNAVALFVDFEGGFRLRLRRFGRFVFTALENDADTRDELAQAEGFHEIIVAADFETDDTVDFVLPRR